jgi:hypothetical protein
MDRAVRALSRRRSVVGLPSVSLDAVCTGRGVVAVTILLACTGHGFPAWRPSPANITSYSYSRCFVIPSPDVFTILKFE